MRANTLRNLIYQAAIGKLLLVSTQAAAEASEEQQQAWLAELAKRSLSDASLARFLRFWGYRPPQEPFRPEAREKPSLTVFVVGHQRSQLARVGEAPHLQKVYLHDISFSRRELAENRIYLGNHLLGCPSEYLGLASASWNRKYDGKTNWHGRFWPHCLPLERLHELPLEPRVVWAAALTNHDFATGIYWSYGLDKIFRGIHPLAMQVANHFGLRHFQREGVLANNYVAHRSVVRSLAKFMRSAIDWLTEKYGPVWPIKPDRCGMFTNRLPAFLGEAISILFWANQTDLELRQIPPP